MKIGNWDYTPYIVYKGSYSFFDLYYGYFDIKYNHDHAFTWWWETAVSRNFYGTTEEKVKYKMEKYFCKKKKEHEKLTQPAGSKVTLNPDCTKFEKGK